MARTKKPGKTAFYKRTRKDKPGITDVEIRKLWDAKQAKAAVK